VFEQEAVAARPEAIWSFIIEIASAAAPPRIYERTADVNIE